MSSLWKIKRKPRVESDRAGDSLYRTLHLVSERLAVSFLRPPRALLWGKTCFQALLMTLQGTLVNEEHRSQWMGSSQ